VITVLKSDLLKEREAREKDRRNAEDSRAAALQTERNAREDLEKRHEAEVEGWREKLTKAHQDRNNAMKEHMEKLSLVEKKSMELQMEGQEEMEKNRMLELEIINLKQQVKAESDRADEAMAERRRALQDAEAANQDERKSLTESLSKEPMKLSNSMKKSALRSLMRLKHNGTNDEKMEALLEWKLNGKTERELNQKKEEAVTEIIKHVINNWIYVWRTRCVVQWRGNFMSLRIHKQLEEDCLVHKKARTNSEVEITVLKNRLKRNERNYQSELEAAIRSREELERILADDAGKDVARKLNEMVIQSSNEIQARKDAEEELQQVRSVICETFGPEAGLETLRESHIALSKVTKMHDCSHSSS